MDACTLYKWLFQRSNHNVVGWLPRYEGIDSNGENTDIVLNVSRRVDTNLQPSPE